MDVNVKLIWSVDMFYPNVYRIEHYEGNSKEVAEIESMMDNLGCDPSHSYVRIFFGKNGDTATFSRYEIKEIQTILK